MLTTVETWNTGAHDLLLEDMHQGLTKASMVRDGLYCGVNRDHGGKLHYFVG